MSIVAKYITVAGLVQGVGFRPFVYRNAVKYGLKGWVRNYSGGVEVHAEGQESRCKDFIRTLVTGAPRSSLITGLEEKSVKVENMPFFVIMPSIDGYKDITNISPDISVCPNCLHDIKSQPRRFNYPFTNCAHCGPRFSLIGKIPYDRRNTTMDIFEMCPECEKEYRDTDDRRFHAQTISCKRCGPHYHWTTIDSEETQFEKILPHISSALARGEIIAIKGTGGFQLICDARNETSIRRIREIKQRPSKPLAVMFRDIDTLKQFARVTEPEESLLLSWRKPIVILEAIRPPSDEVTRSFNTIGAILPYTAFHHLLMEYAETPVIVFTSANLSGQPLISENQKAIEFFNNKHCDALLYHDREILNKQDDSIVSQIAGGITIIRRSRGFGPEPVFLNRGVEGILAMGADFKNSFCIGKGDRAIMSQYTGDMEDFDVFQHYCKTIDDFFRLFKFRPCCIVYDSHPEYHSSKYGRELAEKISSNGSIALTVVQHHHAHIASVMAEHHIDEKVIGIAMDGTGFGDDGKIWGSEYFICDLERYYRIYHMAYIPLPGGEKAIREPWRLAVAAAFQAIGEEYLDMPLPFHEFISKDKQLIIIKALKNNVNIFESSGMGRLFDIVAAMLNLVHKSNFDGEGPVRLENIYCHDKQTYPVTLLNDKYHYEPVICGIVNDIIREVPEGIISGRFHNTVITMICDGAERIARSSGLKKVVLSGGLFQNKIITEKVIDRLNDKGFKVYINRQVPANDGGIALGQLAIASKKIEKKCV